MGKPKATTGEWDWTERENGDGARIFNKAGIYIADCYGENRKQNAAKIVKCVNLHTQLVVSLKVAFAIIQENCAQTEQMKLLFETLEELKAYEKANR